MKKELLLNLTEISAVSGREKHIFEYITNYLKEKKLKYKFGNLGSLNIVIDSKNKNKKTKTIFIDAHVDEVGFYVVDITKDGYIKFESQGGISKEFVISQKLKIVNNEGKEFFGVALSPSNNSHSGNNGSISEIDKMLLDIGANSKEQVISMGINIGDQITFHSKTIFNNDFIIGKSLDNRIGVYVLIETLEYILKHDFDYNIIISFSTQEEVGLRGVRGAVYEYKPDIAMVIDVSPANDYLKKDEPYGILGKGTMLRHKDAYVIYNREIICYLKNLLLKNNINYQDYISIGGTNSGIIQLINSGIKIIPIGIVARNIHSSNSIANLNDIEETLKFVKIILNDLNSNKIENFNK